MRHAFDFVRMAAVSRANIKLAGSHAGVSIGEDGPSQMALEAADLLAQDGVHARVIDLYSVKPVDVDGLRAAAEATGGRIVTVEDHWPEGGIGEAVLSM